MAGQENISVNHYANSWQCACIRFSFRSHSPFINPFGNPNQLSHPHNEKTSISSIQNRFLFGNKEYIELVSMGTHPLISMISPMDSKAAWNGFIVAYFFCGCTKHMQSTCRLGHENGLTEKITSWFMFLPNKGALKLGGGNLSPRFFGSSRGPTCCMSWILHLFPAVDDRKQNSRVDPAGI